MAGMGDRLIHDYFGVDFELVWDVRQNRIPELRQQLAILEAQHMHWKRRDQQRQLRIMLGGFNQYFAIHHCKVNV